MATASDSRPRTGVAALLSLVLPGAGQIYLGKVGLGLAFLFFTGLAYFINIVIGLAPTNASDPIGPEFFLSGIAALSLHIGSVVTAAKAK